MVNEYEAPTAIPAFNSKIIDAGVKGGKIFDAIRVN
jgi:hypothetical protein